MDPPSNYHDQNPNDLHWFHYFEEDPALQGDEDSTILEDESCNSLDNYLETLHHPNNSQLLVPPPLELDQKYNISDELGFQDFDPFDDLSLWDWCDVITHDHSKPMDLDCNLTSGNATADEGGQKYGSWYWWDEFLPILSCNDRISDDDLKPMDHLHAVTSCDAGGGKVVGRRAGPLELEEIEKHFERPIAMAAKELNVGLTVLKKRCRELNIKRWPHRKLKSLRSLIQNVKEMGLKEEMEMLEEHKRMIEKVPEMELTQKTKKLRQACYKSNYKKRRLVNQSPPYIVIP